MEKIDINKCINTPDDSNNIRPNTFDNYIGQEKIKEIVKVYIEAAKSRKEPVEHMLFYGPPGLGKTTIANIIANKMHKNIKFVTGPNLEKPCDIVAILNSLNEGDILFIDEIHRMNRVVEEVLYSAMEDFFIDVKIGEGANIKTIKLDLPRFTLIGATTRVGMLTAPLRDRFSLINKMQYYTDDELSTIIKKSANILGVKIDDESAMEIATRSRGTPRLANKLLKQVRNFAQVSYDNNITLPVVKEVFEKLGIKDHGFDENDIKYMQAIHTLGDGSPVGISTLASLLGEDEGTIEDVYEPFLIRCGLVRKTPRGRALSKKGLKYIYSSDWRGNID